MAARPGSVPVTLVLGEEELLAERAVADAVAVARERLGPGTSVEEVRAGGLPDGFAMGLATASLFGGGRVVVVQEADGLDATAREAVLALAADPAAGTAVVLRAAAPGRQTKFFKDVQRDAATVLVPTLPWPPRSGVPWSRRWWSDGCSAWTTATSTASRPWRAGSSRWALLAPSATGTWWAGAGCAAPCGCFAWTGSAWSG
jgi:hypothetical protein